MISISGEDDSSQISLEVTSFIKSVLKEIGVRKSPKFMFDIRVGFSKHLSPHQTHFKKRRINLNAYNNTVKLYDFILNNYSKWNY